MGLIKRMCAWKPTDRITISQVVKTLLQLAGEELDLREEAEWDEDEPIFEPNPFPESGTGMEISYGDSSVA